MQFSSWPTFQKMTSGDSSLFIFALVDCVALIGISVFNLINLSDLECDYINAANCCAKLNKIVLPELIFHGVVTLGMLYNWHAILFLQIVEKHFCVGFLKNPQLFDFFYFSTVFHSFYYHFSTYWTASYQSQLAISDITVVIAFLNKSAQILIFLS